MHFHGAPTGWSEHLATQATLDGLFQAMSVWASFGPVTAHPRKRIELLMGCPLLSPDRRSCHHGDDNGWKCPANQRAGARHCTGERHRCSIA
jgi:hypothetical protein